MNPRNKVAILTGGARIGHVVAERLAEAGCDLVLTYRTSRKSAQNTVRAVQERGRKAFAIRADLTKLQQAKKVVTRAKKVFGRVHILVNMASTFRPTAFKRIRSKEWDQNLTSNLKSAYDMALLAAPIIQKSGGGRIVNITDWTVASGRPRYKNFLPYYVAKSGLKGFTEGLALEVAPKILVNSIAPGPILPPKGMSKKESSQVVSVTPLKRWGGAEEIAKAVLFLINSDFVTGETIRVDGGRHLF